MWVAELDVLRLQHGLRRLVPARLPCLDPLLVPRDIAFLARGASAGNGTQRSDNTGRSPRDRQVCAIAASSPPSLLDDDSSVEPLKEMIVAKLNGECLGGCGKVHPPYECPNLVGDVAHQKKAFASLSSKRRFLLVRAITAEADDGDDVNLINFGDPDAEDPDTDQDFP